MFETNFKSNSEGSIQLCEDIAKAILDDSAEVLLTIVKQFGKDSKQHAVAESYFECIKAGYAFIIAKKEFNDLCKEHQMTFDAKAVKEIIAMNKIKALIKEQLDKLGLN